MKRKNGFISISIIYSFFIVFLLLMLALLGSYSNKRHLLKGDELPFEAACKRGASLATCLKNEAKIKYNWTGLDAPTLNWKDIADGSAGETGMYKAPDDYTRLIGRESYYYRGDVDINYVVYGDYLWRIVRVNGDDTYRLIYQGEYNQDASEDESKLKEGSKDYITVLVDETEVEKTKYNISSYNSNECSSRMAFKNAVEDFNNRVSDSWISDYIKWVNERVDESYIKNCLNEGNLIGAHLLHNIGFMNNEEALLYRYDSKYDNQDDSEVKKYLDLWYKQQIEDTNAETLLSLSTIFCGDKNRTKCAEVKGTLDVIFTECSEDKQLDDKSFINALFNDMNSLYEKSERYYYAGWERISKGDANAVSFICPDTGSLATNSQNEVLNLSRYNVSNETYRSRINDDNLSKLGSNSMKKYNLLYNLSTGDDGYVNGYYNRALKEGTTYNEKKNSEIFYDSLAVSFKDSLRYAGKVVYSDVINYDYTLEFIGNGDLTYPIGLLSADEAVYAGLVYGKDGSSYLLDHSNSGNQYWTMTLAYTDYTELAGDTGARYFAIEKTSDNKGKIVEKNDTPKNDGSGAYLRPVINLNKNIKKCDGRGTITDPYIVGESCDE